MFFKASLLGFLQITQDGISAHKYMTDLQELQTEPLSER